VWQAGDADGPWTGDPEHAWVCGETDGGAIAFNGCFDGQYARVGYTFADGSGRSFCCTNQGSAVSPDYRFLPGACD